MSCSFGTISKKMSDSRLWNFGRPVSLSRLAFELVLQQITEQTSELFRNQTLTAVGRVLTFGVDERKNAATESKNKNKEVGNRVRAETFSGARESVKRRVVTPRQREHTREPISDEFRTNNKSPQEL